MGLYDNINFKESEYIPQYAGLPLDRIKQVGDELQERHYSNIANLSRLELLGKQQMAETPFGADREKINSHITEVSEGLQELARNGAENATSRVTAMANRFFGDEELQRLRHNAGEYRKDEAMMREIRTKGGTPIRNEKNHNSWMETGSYDADGNLREYKSTVQPKLDYMKAQDEVVNPLQPDTWESDLKAAAKTSLRTLMVQQGKLKPGQEPTDEDVMAAMPAFMQSDTYRQLTKDKVNDFLFKEAGNAKEGLGWQNYKSTSEYKQQKEVLGLSDQEIKAELQGRGEAKVFSDHQKQFQAAPYSSLLGSRGASKVETYSNAYTELFKAPPGSIQTDENGDIVKLGKEFSFSDLFNSAKQTWDGKNPDVVQGTLNYLPAAIEAGIKYMMNNKDTLTPAQKDELKGYQYALGRTNSTLPGDKQMNLPGFISMLGKDMNAPVHLFDEKKRVEDESFKFTNTTSGGGDFLTRKIYNTDGETLTAKEYYDKEFDLDFSNPENVKKFKEGASVIGITDPKNLAFARAKVGTYLGKTFLIDDSDNATAVERYIHDTYKFGRLNGSGIVQTVNPQTGKPMRVQGYFDGQKFVTEQILD